MHARAMQVAPGRKGENARAGETRGLYPCTTHRTPPRRRGGAAREGRTARERGPVPRRARDSNPRCMHAIWPTVCRTEWGAGQGPLAPRPARTWSRLDENTQAALGYVRGASPRSRSRAPSFKADLCSDRADAPKAHSRGPGHAQRRTRVRWLEVAGGHNPTHFGARTVPYAGAWRRGKESNPRVNAVTGS